MPQNRQAATPNQSRPQKDEAPRKSVNVVATRTGFYDLRRIREGQEFAIRLREGEALPSWVQPVGREGAAPARTAGNQAPPPPPGADESQVTI